MTQALSPVRGSLALFKAAYPNAEITDATIGVYEAALNDLHPQDIADAVAALLKESKFMPTIAEIREVVAEHALALPGETEAWIEAEMRSFGNWGDRPKHPLVNYVIKGMGGTYLIRTSDAPQITRAQFIKSYREVRAKAIQIFVRTGVAPDMPTIAERERIEEIDDAFVLIPAVEDSSPTWMPQVEA